MNFLQQNYVKYALVMVGLIILCLFSMEVTGQNQTFDKSPLVAFFMMIAPFILLYLCIRAKKKLLKGKMTFKQGVAEGFKMSLVFATVSPFVFLFYYVVINPGIIANVRDAYFLEDAPDSTIIAIDMAVQFVGSLIGGTLYAALVSLFLRSKAK